ncbi:MAG: hypothetical protein QXJ59_06660 [Thermofilaceae archaeon]
MTMPVVKLDRHEAIRTCARTYWKVVAGREMTVEVMTVEEAVKKGLLKPLLATYGQGKTHWEEYYEVTDPEVTFVRVRISNRGNVEVRKLTPAELAVNVEELEKIKAAIDP